jgi:hypothetical protein
MTTTTCIGCKKKLGPLASVRHCVKCGKECCLDCDDNWGGDLDAELCPKCAEVSE